MNDSIKIVIQHNLKLVFTGGILSPDQCDFLSGLLLRATPEIPFTGRTRYLMAKRLPENQEIRLVQLPSFTQSLRPVVQWVRIPDFDSGDKGSSPFRSFFADVTRELV